MPKTRTPKKPAPARAPTLRQAQVHELIHQALETELGGVEVYTTALRCAQNAGLRTEWKKYLEQTREHVKKVEGICRALGMDVEQETTGRLVVRSIGESLVGAMEMALASGDKAAAEIVAAECVTLAETKDYLNWELLGEVLEAADDALADVLAEPQESIEEEEDEHLYHSQGWARELWIKGLGLPAALPPPEERQDVKTASAAEKAKKGRAKVAKAHKSAEA